MNSAMSQLPAFPCYINGQYTTIDKATISPMDRGFIFGDGVYEVLPFYKGKPFRLDDHLARLDSSLAQTRITNPYSNEQWQTIFSNLLIKTDSAQNYLLYLQISRGVAIRDHVMPAGLQATVFAFVQPMPGVPETMRERGVSCVTAEDFRWLKGSIKSTSLLGAVFARQISADQGCLETIMFRADCLTEAAASNVWVVKNGRVFGPKPDQRVLRGIRYGVIETICKTCGIDFEIRDIARSEVFEADELLLSSATKEVLAITSLDGKPVGKGIVGTIYQRLFDQYQILKNS